MVGNDFVRPRPRLQLAAPGVTVEPPAPLAITPIIRSHQEHIPVAVKRSEKPRFSQWLDVAHRHSFIIFSALFLLVAVSGIEVGS